MTPELREALVCAIRAAKLALFVVEKHGAMPNDSWRAGFDKDIAVAEAALARPSTSDRGGEVEVREIAWLIERANFKPEDPRPHWYAENATGFHWWTLVAHDAKRFATEAEVRAFPAFQMIADDPNISVTEHVFVGPTRIAALVTDKG